MVEVNRPNNENLYTEWQTVKLGDVLKVQGGYAFKSKDSTLTGIRWLKIANVGMGKVLWEDISYLPSNYKNDFDNYVLIPNDIIMAMTRPVLSGNTKVAKVGIDDSPSLLNQRVCRFQFSNRLESEYFYHYARTSKFSSDIENLIFGTDPPNISSTQIESINILLPTKKEQRKISNILSTVDDQIEQTEKLVVKTNELKKGLMQILLTKGIDHNEFKNSEIGNIPFDWEVKRIEEVCDVKGGKRLPKGYKLLDQNNGFPYIRVADMDNMGSISLKDIKYVPEEIVQKIVNYRISKDDLYISVAGTLGIVGKVPDELDGANLTENADKLTNIKCNKDFLLYVLKSSIIQKNIDNEKTLSAQPKLALTRIKNFLIPIPSIDEQERIANILQSVEQQIEQYGKKHKKLVQLKKGLMQKLLTGKIRVNV
ncbi:restriction endonuclease subunit S [Bacillus sp. ISL-41]|uniref:restriction endonuclease subunit S n=1 Tax=Bacillus sp. ISL-41 TaxID=2819127 RepID=UPI001BECB375|nr:restriction endonuclease subunit S [Bacillus sp. ISL-41]MBT2644768.1 restriction endonuclease subunit S [Bacillus sp. ISL-41]